MNAPFDALLASLQTAARVRVRHLPLTDFGPEYTAYQINGVTAADVQREITRIMNFVSDHGGKAEFRNPERTTLGEYEARGYSRIAS